MTITTWIQNIKTKMSTSSVSISFGNLITGGFNNTMQDLSDIFHSGASITLFWNLL